MRLIPRRNSLTPRRIKRLLLDRMTGLLVAVALATKAQDVQHLSITVPGGMPGWPVLTGISVLTNGVNVTWDGPPGYYQLF
jgi:hypothetical protein